MTLFIGHVKHILNKMVVTYNVGLLLHVDQIKNIEYVSGSIRR